MSGGLWDEEEDEEEEEETRDENLDLFLAKAGAYGFRAGPPIILSSHDTRVPST